MKNKDKIASPCSGKWVKILAPSLKKYDSNEILGYTVVYVNEDALSSYSDYIIISKCNKLEDFKL